MTVGAAMADRSRTVVGRDGRAKAFRPLPADVREEALRDGIAAYERGDFFLAHEHLEPAWMGTDDLAERSLHQGLIKLAAAYVHAVRGNPRGTHRNLEGARTRLAEAAADRPQRAGLDLSAIIAQVEDRLDRLAADPGDATIDPPVLTRSES